MNKLKTRVAIVAASLSLSCSALMAQQQMQPLPLDPSVRYGQLDNGLTYYIRHNEQPKQRAEFHIAQAVGAILEEDNQNGLAHFLEHMAFNGSEHFHDKGIINYFESIGVSFGGDINAYTSLDETVYRLSNVPTIRTSIVDSALLVLCDWSNALLLEDEEIDAERGVILEEWRTRAGAQRRMWKESNAQMFPGSQYAKRDVIGDTAVILHHTYDALRDYYHKWYGPDLQGIIVVGDVDVDYVENKIKEYWNKVPARKNRGERPVYTYGQNKEPIVSIVTDKEAQYGIFRLMYKNEPMPREVRATQAGLIMELVNNVVEQVLDYRFTDMVQKPDANIVQGGGSYDETQSKGDAAFNLFAVAKAGHEKAALNDLLLMAQSIRRYGISDSELERARKDLLNKYEKAYNERDNRTNNSITQECIRNFLDGDPMPGIELEYQFASMLLPQLPAQVYNEACKQYVTDENLIISLQGSPDMQLPDKQEVEAMWRESLAAQIEAPKEEKFDHNLIDRKPKAGKIKSETRNATFGTTEWILSNGARVIVKPTEYKKDEILFTARSFGGLSLVSTADLYSASLASDIVEQSGLGKFSNTQLQKVLTGQTISISPSIDDYSESLRGSSSVKDFETMLQLTYLYFTAPRTDKEAYQTLMNTLETVLRNRDTNPKAVYQDSVSLITSGHNPRTLLLNTAALSHVDQQRAMQIFSERFNSPSDFVFFITGNVNPDDPALRKAVTTWLGSVKAAKAENWKDNGERTPQGRIDCRFTRQMTTTTATNFVVYTAPMDYTLQNRLNMSILGECLSTRYLESIREREGGSYGVGVRGMIDDKPVKEAQLIMSFDTDPAKEDKLLQIIHDELKEIAENGPRADDLAKAKEIKVKDFNQSLERNQYWNSTILYRYYIEGVDYLTDYIPAVKAVTAETVQAAAKAMLQAGNVIQVVMMPE